VIYRTVTLFVTLSDLCAISEVSSLTAACKVGMTIRNLQGGG